MLAYRLVQAQTQPEFQEVPEPHAGPGQVVVRVAGSGLCHTDFTVISRERSYWKNEPPPFTLGHEIAGWVEEVGTGVTKFRRGDAVAVNPSWASCGRCHMCRSGEENHCLYQKAIRAPGVGYDGGHAPYVLVPEARFLVPIGDLDPVAGRAAHGCRHHDIHRDQAGASRDLAGQHRGRDRRRRFGALRGSIPPPADRRTSRRRRLERSQAEAGSRVRRRRRRLEWS